jgi:hypothetical protein
MALTGWPDEPLFAPTEVTVAVQGLGRVIAALSRALGHEVEVDPLAIFGERAAIGGLVRRGQTSCGGSTRLLPVGDGWLAVALVRPEDVASLPAWLETDTGWAHRRFDGADPGRWEADEEDWSRLARLVADRPGRDLVERGALLGLAVAELARARPGGPATSAVVGAGPIDPPPRLGDLVVADLSSLWAGPLCGHVLGLGGARVIKVESVERPDGARRGPAAFFDLLHGGHESVALDFGSVEGRASLRRVLAAADVVIEGSRPRALRHLGVIPEEVMAAGRTRVWVSLTGYGRSGIGADRIAFGDDGAVGGGLVARSGQGPCFCADAVADPATGLVAAAAALAALSTGRRWLLDIALSRVAGALAGRSPSIASAWRPAAARPDVWIAPPRSRSPVTRGPRLGEHTAAVLDRLPN